MSNPTSRTTSNHPEEPQVTDELIKTISTSHDAWWSLSFRNDDDVFNPADWKVIPWNGMPRPEHTQPKPAPLPNSERYLEFHIPSINRRTASRTDAGLKKFKSKMEKLWKERKRTFRHGFNLLHITPSPQTNSFGRAPDVRETCPRCSSTFFDPNKRRLVCYDCRFSFPTYLKTYDEPSEGTLADKRAPKAYRARRHLTLQEFIAGLLLRHQFERLFDEAELRKTCSAYLILCEGWLARDVLAFTSMKEPRTTLANRADRIFDTVKQFKKTGQELPKPTAEDISRLKTLVECELSHEELRCMAETVHTEGIATPF